MLFLRAFIVDLKSYVKLLRMCYIVAFKCYWYILTYTCTNSIPGVTMVIWPCLTPYRDYSCFLPPSEIPGLPLFIVVSFEKKCPIFIFERTDHGLSRVSELESPNQCSKFCGRIKHVPPGFKLLTIYTVKNYQYSLSHLTLCTFPDLIGNQSIQNN